MQNQNKMSFTSLSWLIFMRPNKGKQKVIYNNYNGYKYIQKNKNLEIIRLCSKVCTVGVINPMF